MGIHVRLGAGNEEGVSLMQLRLLQNSWDGKGVFPAALRVLGPLGPFWVFLVFRRVGFVETSRFGAIFGKVLPCLFPGERLMAAERVVPKLK